MDLEEVAAAVCRRRIVGLNHPGVDSELPEGATFLIENSSYTTIKAPPLAGLLASRPRRCSMLDSDRSMTGREFHGHTN